MARLRRKKRRIQSESFDFYSLSALMLGWRDPAKYPFHSKNQVGFRNLAEVRQGWEKNKLNPKVSRCWEPRSPYFQPGRRPWAWWEFESKEPRNRLIPQWEQLDKMGELNKVELEELPRLRRYNDFFKKAYIPGYSNSPSEDKNLTAEIQNQRIDATDKVKSESWFQWIVEDDGLVSSADADAILNHGCYIDEFQGFHVIDFIETFCKSSETGDFLTLMYWQTFGFIFPLYAWHRADGTRRFRECYLHVSKKHGKSTLLSCLAIYGATLDGEDGPRCYSTAVKRDQAKIVHGEAAAMVRTSPDLLEILKPIDSRSVIRCRRTNIDVMEALASGNQAANSNEGWKTYMLINDELHAWTDRKLYGTLKYGMKGRRQPFRLAISTAGEDKATLGGEKYEYACNIRDGNRQNYSFLAVIFEPPTETDFDLVENAENKEFWYMANPALGLTISESQFADDLLTAREESDHSWGDFLRYNMNIWIRSGLGFINMRFWKEGHTDFKEQDFYGCECWGGLDLASTTDLASLVWVFRKDKDYFVISRAWAPESRVKYMTEKGLAPYHDFAKAGHLQVTRGEVIDYSFILKQILEDCDNFDVRNIAFDRYGSQDIIAKLMDAGIDVVEHGQGYLSMSAPTRELENLIMSKRIKHNDQLLDWSASNVTVTSDASDNVKPVKPDEKLGRHKKIDPIVALIMALTSAVVPEDRFSSSYEKEELTIF